MLSCFIFYIYSLQEVVLSISNYYMVTYYQFQVIPMLTYPHIFHQLQVVLNI